MQLVEWSGHNRATMLLCFTVNHTAAACEGRLPFRSIWMVRRLMPASSMQLANAMRNTLAAKPRCLTLSTHIPVHPLYAFQGCLAPTVLRP